MRPGPIGPPRPSTVSVPPPASPTTAMSAQNRPGRSPRLLNQPLTPAIDPPCPTHPSLRNPCIATMTPTTTRRTKRATSALMWSLPAYGEQPSPRRDSLRDRGRLQDLLGLREQRRQRIGRRGLAKARNGK